MHPHRLTNARHASTDAADADDTQRPARQFPDRFQGEAPIGIGCPFTFSDGLAMHSYVSDQFEHQGSSVLRHTVTDIGWNVRNHDTLPLGNVGIHHIVSGCQHTDIF